MERIGLDQPPDGVVCPTLHHPKPAHCPAYRPGGLAWTSLSQQRAGVADVIAVGGEKGEVLIEVGTADGAFFHVVV